MITDILKFVIEVAVISFIAYYVTNKFYKKISIVDSLFIGIVLSVFLTAGEKCYSFLNENFEEEGVDDDDDDEEDVEEEDDEDTDDEDTDEEEKWEAFAEVEPEKKVVVNVDSKGIIKSSETRPVATEQVRGRLSMQEQKIVDAVQTEAVKKEIKDYKDKKPRTNPNYGYSFLPPSEWNLPLPEMKKCIPQKVCAPCPLLALDNGGYLQLPVSSKLPPAPVEK
jgi:hypothetical protein